MAGGIASAAASFKREFIMRRIRTVSKAVLHERQTTSFVSSAVGASGFTLVEMLVAVTLVLIMMSMFAEIFQIAGGSIAKTRGLAENDQRSRTLQTIIKADLDKRSYRWVYPFAANESASAPESNIGNRQGYFYISENNPYNSLDDVLQFTMVSTITSRNKDESPYYGQALNLASFSYPNQPDADDGQLNPNNTGLSTVAEVVYFVRNGNLYRRQLLVREQLSIAGSNAQPDDSIPNNNPNGTNVFGPIVAVGPPQVPAFQYSPTGPFWNDFDYSAYYNEQPAGTPTGAHFLGSDSLSNSGSNSLNAIAAPFRRFGHYHRGLGVANGHAGRPKEFADDTTAALPYASPYTIGKFIGRFTLEECSHSNFRYPQNKTGTATTYIPTDPSKALNVVNPLDPNDKTLDDFRNGPRRGEDLLLSNVQAFDILVWDEGYGGFVNIGDPNLPLPNPGGSPPTPGADYALANRYGAGYGLGTAPSPTYGPRVTENTAVYATNAVFDTWHPLLNLDTSNDPGTLPDPTTGQTQYDEPPFRSQYFKPASVSGGSTFYDKPAWEPNHTYSVGDIVFPTGPPATQYTSPPYPVGITRKLPYGAPFYYRCIRGAMSAGTSGVGTTDYLFEPTWAQAEGLNVTETLNTTAAAGSLPVQWQAVDNRKPLKAIKLEVRFMDASTQQLRQLTIIHSLVD